MRFRNYSLTLGIISLFMTSYDGLSQSYNYEIKIDKIKTSEQVDRCLESLAGNLSIVPKYNSRTTRFEFVSSELLNQKEVTEKLQYDGYAVVQFKMKSNQHSSTSNK